MQRLGDGRQDDVEAADEELAHHHGHDDGEDEADLGEPAEEDGWALAAEALEVCLEEAFVGVIVGGAEGVCGEGVMGDRGSWLDVGRGEEAMEKRL